MDPLLLLVSGAAVAAAGMLVLRSFGPAYRLGRLLAVTRSVTVADAAALADRADRYVRVDGRIDSEAEFLDEDRRPLVFWRARLQVRRRGAWSTVDEQRRAVPFVIRQGLDEIGVAVEELTDGVVVVPRESSGRAAEIAGRLPPGTPPSAGVRYRVELISTVDHATVLGVPRLDDAGRALIGAGRDRPLVVSTLQGDEAMRVLAGGRRVRSIAAASLLAGGLALLVGGGAWAVIRALP